MKKKRRILNAALVLLLAAALICGWRLLSERRESAAMDAAADAAQGSKPAQDDDAMDFAVLQAGNPDIIAWLAIPGTAIDYPVLQAADNEYYLTHDAEKKPNKNGALFLDYRVHADFSDFSSVIYGHHMKSGRMLQNLVLFKDKAYFDSHGEALLYMPGRTQRMEIFAVALVHRDSPLYAYAFFSPAEQEAHLALLREKAMFFRDPNLAPGDRLILLSTCSYEYADARTIVVCKVPF